MNKILGLTAASVMALMASTAFAERENQLSDERVRAAIAYAIDMDTIVETLFEGKAIVADSMIPNGPYKADGLERYAYDPDKARALLEEAGWDDSQVLDVVYYYGDQLTADLMVALQAQLADVGVQMTYRKLEGDVGGQLNALPEDGSDTSAVTWDIAYGAKAALALQEYYNGYQSGKNSYTPGDPARDALIDAINGTVDVGAQQEAFKAFTEFENSALSDIALYYQQLFIYESNRLDRNGGQYGNDQFVYDWGITNWTVEPDENGKSVMYTNTAPSTFFDHPWLNPGIYIFSKVGLDRLMTADGALAPTEGQLAESVDVAEDGMSVTFDLKDGITWHDGTALTADDVVWSIETAKTVPGINAVFSSTFDAISDMSVDGDKITISFGTLDPNMLLTFSQFAPLPKHLLEGVNPAEFQQHPFWQNPVGSGPFRIEEVQMNDFVRFVPFENYHGGVAKIQEIVAFPSGENDGNVIQNAEAGRLDYGFTKSVGDVQALEAMDHMNVIPADIPYTRSLRINKFAKIAE
ncbi:MAG: peptide ABC transporter substrate-binding protein [Rhodobacteraceae bacterium]|nr:peptide ABC transporter substrate-binding protein [Paracoccaceae bacterium]